MFRFKLITVAIAVTLNLSPFAFPCLWSAEPDYFVSFDASAYSSYLWRGIILDSDPVFQPSVSLETGNFTVTTFLNEDMGNNDSINSDEADFIADYTVDFEKLSVSAGHIYYHLPGLRSYSKEFYCGVRLTKIPALPYFSYYYDYGPRGGTYFSADFSFPVKIIKIDKLNTNLGLHLGYNNDIIVSGTGKDVLFLLDIGYPITKLVGGSLVLGYNLPYGGLSDKNNLNQNPAFYGGIRLGF